MKENPEVTRLLSRGKERGMVTYEEINEALGPAEQLDPEQLEDLLQSFENEGVQVVEKEKESAAETESVGVAPAAEDEGLLVRRSRFVRRTSRPLRGFRSTTRCGCGCEKSGRRRS